MAVVGLCVVPAVEQYLLYQHQCTVLPHPILVVVVVHSVVVMVA